MAATMFRTRTLLVMGLLALTASSASADWGSFAHKLHLGFHRNIAWPDPFTEVDAIQTVAPFEVMKRNGWRTHNTIGHELFRAGDGALLASGQNRVRWIATQSPENRREIHVLNGMTPEETDARVSAVREAIAHLAIQGSEPQVLVTSVQPPTAPGAWAVKINRDAREQMAPPRLPTVTASGAQGVYSSVKVAGTIPCAVRLQSSILTRDEGCIIKRTVGHSWPAVRFLGRHLMLVAFRSAKDCVAKHSFAEHKATIF